MNFNVIDKKTINLKTIYILIFDVFFSQKNVTKCLGHHYAIWTSDYLLAQKNCLGPAKALISGTAVCALEHIYFAGKKSAKSVSVAMNIFVNTH